MAIDLSVLMPAVNFSTTTVAILAAAAAVVVVVITINAYHHIRALLTGKVYFAGRYWHPAVYQKAMHEVNSHIRSGKLVDATSRKAWKRYSGLDNQRRRRTF